VTWPHAREASAAACCRRRGSGGFRRQHLHTRMWPDMAHRYRTGSVARLPGPAGIRSGWCCRTVSGRQAMSSSDTARRSSGVTEVADQTGEGQPGETLLRPEIGGHGIAASFSHSGRHLRDTPGGTDGGMLPHLAASRAA
jgi:hypothetical protein